jgi:signal transduction histidine kinase/ActR/RegA family two-component response regulator
MSATALSPSLAPDLSFLAEGGEMGERIRAHDWQRTPLGAPETWRPGLKAMVRMALTTQHPIFIFWGPQSIGLYNDAYRASLGPEKHPSILGMPGRQAWEEIWPIIGPQIDTVMRGEGATWHENQLVPIYRHGGLDDVYWTYSFGPIDEPSAPQGVGGVLVICTETTRQVLAERRQASERDRFEEMFHQAPSFMAVLRGPTHIYEMANPAYLRLVGGRPVVGKSVAEALPEALEQGYVELLDRVYTEGVSYTARRAQLSLQAAAGEPAEERFLDFVYQPMRDARGQVIGIFVEGVDVTQEQELLQSLQQSDRRKDEFLAMLAHELRNPLAPIVTASHLLSRTDLTRERIVECGLLVKRQSSIIALLLDDLLDISRITSGKLILRKTRVQARVMVDSAVEAARPLLESKHHRMRVTLPEEPLFLDADPLRLPQILINLLTNAAKYTDAGGEIGLDVYARDGHVHFDVSDNGIGLTPEHCDQLFQMFYQVQNGDARSQGGLGIGLALTRGLVELHGGSIAAHSDGPGRGSVFRVALPAPAGLAAAPVAGAAWPAAQTTRAREHRVLVVDDNVDVGRTLEMSLDMDGYDVRLAHNGEEALLTASRFRPHAVFLDIGMPGMSGYEVAGRIRAADWGRDVLLVATTGWGQSEDKRRAMAAGFDLHLTKPISPDAVAKLLAERLKGRKQ